MPQVPSSGSEAVNRRKATYYRAAIIGGVALITLGIHYGFVLEPIFGDQHWIHAIHGRLCYLPIVIAAAWFGVRGGLWTAAAISLLVLPYLLFTDIGSHNLAGEITEIVFYFALAALIGVLVQREFRARQRQQESELALARSHQLSLAGQIASGVAHEIKNPLASIKGAVEILCDRDTPEEARGEFRDIVVRETGRIDQTLRDFLEFGRPRQSQFQPLDLSETVAATVRQIDASAAAAGVEIIRDIAAGVRVRGDGEKIHQVLLNLLLNALEALPSGGRISVTVARSGDKARLTVSDTGAGIEAEALPRVFEPFYTTKLAGSGLGLAIAKQIIDDHGGTIAVESNPGTGTTFAITLPIGEGA